MFKRPKSPTDKLHDIYWDFASFITLYTKSIFYNKSKNFGNIIITTHKRVPCQFGSNDQTDNYGKGYSRVVIRVTILFDFTRALLSCYTKYGLCLFGLECLVHNIPCIYNHLFTLWETPKLQLVRNIWSRRDGPHFQPICTKLNSMYMVCYKP